MGSGDIQGYIIEKRDVDMRIWMTAAEISGSLTTGTVNGLREDSTYEFRVCAVNKAGQGAPSDPVLLERSKLVILLLLSMHVL